MVRSRRKRQQPCALPTGKKQGFNFPEGRSHFRCAPEQDGRSEAVAGRKGGKWLCHVETILEVTVDLVGKCASVSLQGRPCSSSQFSGAAWFQRATVWGCGGDHEIGPGEGIGMQGSWRDWAERIKKKKPSQGDIFLVLEREKERGRGMEWGRERKSNTDVREASIWERNMRQRPPVPITEHRTAT